MACDSLANFFLIGPLPGDRYMGVYDLRLIALSYLVAVFASYIALDLTGRLRDHNNTRKSSLLWLLGGAIAMGAGIWSMHFIGMLSFSIPGIVLQYDLLWTGISLIVAIGASGFALYLLKKSIINIVHLIAGGVILGLAIASMHYTGMEGILVTLDIQYLPNIFILSVIIAIVASEAAIWLALKSNKVILKFRNRIKLVSAIIMGVAICGMHYTGMAASIFTPLCAPSLTTGYALDPNFLAISIASVTFIILGIAFYASSYKESQNQQAFEQARQLGMAEISASVLHSVGNVLNSVNVSANTISEKISSSKLSDLKRLNLLLKQHQHNLGSFLTEDPQGKKVLTFLEELAQYHQNEQQNCMDEIKIVQKNIGTIRDIISTQQTLSKPFGVENIISINQLLDEALLIIGLASNKEIIVEKNYEKLAPIVIDKVKLLQVFINIIKNAKDALLQAKNSNKQISINTFIRDNRIIIEIHDNGIGILAKNINKIFRHGFTTKETGHGFGLHTSALVVNELGGEIKVKSEGLGKGATFIISLPNTQPK